MRDLIIEELRDMYRESKSYADYITESHNPWDRHHEILHSLERACDRILLTLYRKAIQGEDLFPVSVDKDGRYADILFYGRIYGGMTEAGSTHT